MTAAESEYFATFMANNNLSIDIMGPQEYSQRILQDDALFGSLIQELGLGQ